MSHFELFRAFAIVNKVQKRKPGGEPGFVFFHSAIVEVEDMEWELFVIPSSKIAFHSDVL